MEEIIAKSDFQSRYLLTNSKSGYWVRGLLVLLLLLFLISVYFYFQTSRLKKNLIIAQGNQRLASETDTSNIKKEDEVKQLVEAVGNLIVLPKDEQPTVATVADLEKLKNQPFFAEAEIGDKVLIYPNAQKAILYRPNINKIISLAPFVLPKTTTEDGKMANTDQNQARDFLTIEIRNGSGKTGAANEMKNKLIQANSLFSVIKTGNSQIVYSKNLLYIVPGRRYTPVAEALSLKLGLNPVLEFPSNEASTTADALLILGR